MKTVEQKIVFAFVAAITLISFATAKVAAQSLFEVDSVDLIVYRDGLVHVAQTLTVNELAPEKHCRSSLLLLRT